MVDSCKSPCNGSALSFTQQATIMSSNMNNDDRDLKIENLKPIVGYNPQSTKNSLSQKPLKIKKNNCKGAVKNKSDLSTFTNR